MRTRFALVAAACLLLASSRAEADDTADTLTKMPVLTRAVDPRFPPGAIAKGVEATVTLTIDVDAAGNVESVTVVGQEGGEGFDFAASALAAAKQFHFEPAEADGAPVPVTISYKYKFALPTGGRIAGVVVDRASQKPVAGVRVEAVGQIGGKWLRTEAVSGADGTFAFDAVPPGKWEIRGRAAGFRAVSADASLEPRGASQVRLALEPLPTGGDYDVLVDEQKEREEKGRVYADPSSVTSTVPRVSRVVVVRAAPAGPPGGRGAGRGPGGGRPGGGRPGGGGQGGGRPPGGGGGGRPPGGGGGGPGGGGFGGGRGGGGGGPNAGGAGGPALGAGAAPVATTQSLTLATLAQRGDIATVVANTNGLALRGIAPAGSRVVLDGIDVPLAYHFGSIRPIVPIGIIEEARFYTGNYPLEYGRATGGIVEIQTYQTIATKTTGYVDANWADMSGTIKTPLAKNMSLSLSGQASTLDYVLHDVVGSQAVSVGSLPRYADGEIKINYRPTPSARLQLLGMASRDRYVDWFGDASQGELAPGTVGLDTSFHRAIFTSELDLAKDLTAKLVLGAGSDEVAQRGPDFDVTVWKVQARPSLKWKIAGPLTAHLGAEYLVEQMSGSLVPAAEPQQTPGASGTLVLPQMTGRVLGAYAGVDWEMARGFVASPGLRVDRYWVTDETVVEPRVLVRWEFLRDLPAVKSLALKAAFGVHHQPPSLLQTSTLLGNPGLTSESARQYRLGADYRPILSLLIDFAVFYVDRDNVVIRSAGTVTRNGATVPEVFSNAASGASRGIELFVQQELWNGLAGWLYYTYSVSDITTTADGTTSPSPYDETHVLGVALAYALPAGWKISTRFQYASGLPTTSVVGSVFDSSTNTYVTTPGTTLGDRTPAFEQLDLRAEKRFELGSGTSLTAYVDVRNVMNRSNVISAYAYNYDASRQYSRTGIPILPMVGARADF